MNIPDAPWIRETEATGYCSAANGAWWNNPPDEDYEEEEDDVQGDQEDADDL